MLSQFIALDLVQFHESFATWQEAVKASCQKFLEHGYISEAYVQSIIDCVSEHGPYIIIAPDIALPHSTQGGEGVYKTGISFMKVNQPVSFDTEDPTKDARLFFTLAAEDSEQHLANITSLMELLMNEEVSDALKEVSSLSELRALAEKFNL